MTATQVHPDIRKQRLKATAEVFTPPSLVNEMIDKLTECSNNSVWQPNKTFCDPACGNGNFLIEILQRKLNHKHDTLDALKSIYGADIQQDNIRECRVRLLTLVNKYTPVTVDHIKAVCQNIVYIDIKEHPQGSLEYHFDFNHQVPAKEITAWLKHWNNDVAEKLPVSPVTFDAVDAVKKLPVSFDTPIKNNPPKKQEKKPQKVKATRQKRVKKKPQKSYVDLYSDNVAA